MNIRATIRVQILRYTAIFFIFALGLRLWHLQIIQGEELKEKAQRQSTADILVQYDRGQFYYRDMSLMTNTTETLYGVALSSGEKEDIHSAIILSQYSWQTKDAILQTLTKQKFVVTKLNSMPSEETQKLFPSVKFTKQPSRYESNAPAAQLLGYLSDGAGVMGLEKTFEKELAGEKKPLVSARVDALRRKLPDQEIEVSNVKKGSGIRTTLDKRVQEITQKALKRQNIKGCAVVLDVATGDILAMESSPSYDQGNIQEALKNDKGQLINRALEAYDAGSVFKIVVAAAALEMGVVNLDTKFFCSGEIDVSGQRFGCHKKEGHGEVTFLQGFAYSCNPVFIEIGEKIGYNNLIEYAQRFGLGEKSLFPYEIDQKKGNVPAKNSYYLADLANLSMGQGSLSVTALQAANIVAVVARGGTIKGVSIVDSLVDEQGKPVRSYRLNFERRIISEETAKKIQLMMIETIKTGTGTSADLKEYGGAGGKTGSAQTGWMVSGEMMQHGWFVGYFPVDTPKYAVCVFAENGRSGSVTCAPVFKEIGENLLS